MYHNLRTLNIITLKVALYSYFCCAFYFIVFCCFINLILCYSVIVNVVCRDIQEQSYTI